MTQDADTGIMPHCDDEVLHAPGECEYCDMRPDLQQARRARRIAFTGHRPDVAEYPCPSDFRRGTGGAHAWPGNRPTRAPTDDCG